MDTHTYYSGTIQTMSIKYSGFIQEPPLDLSTDSLETKGNVLKSTIDAPES